MKLALISMRPKIGDVKSNIEKMKKYISKKKADMYVFGETTLTGYTLRDELRDYAESINGLSINELKKIAKAKKCYIVFGMPLKNKDVTGLIHNSAILIHPDGKVDSYNKWFMPTFGPFEEKIFYDEGEDINIIKTKFGKIGLIVCYDIYFPELCKAYSLQGADMVICLSATPQVNRYYFESLIPARAIENTIFFTYVNIVGTQEDLVFFGGAQISDPFGKILVKAPYFKESIIIHEIDLNSIKQARAVRPVIRDIRPQIYEDLYHISRKHTKPTKK